MTARRWSQLAVTGLFLALVRTLGEYFRLRHAGGAPAGEDVLAIYVAGALVAAVACWISVTLYFFRRYRSSALVFPLAVAVMLCIKFTRLS